MLKIKVIIISMVIYSLVTISHNSYSVDQFNFSFYDKEVDVDLDKWYYAYSLADIFNNHETSKRIADVIIKTSEKYNLDAYMVARQCYKESFMLRWKRSKNSKTGEVVAWGLFMLRPKYWSHLLYRVDDGKLGKYILENPEQDPNRFFLRIGYNAEMYGLTITHFLNKNDGDMGKALTSYYAGKNSTEMKSYLNGESNHYVDEILHGKLEHEILTKLKGKWQYYDNKYSEYYIKRLKGEVI